MVVSDQQNDSCADYTANLVMALTKDCGHVPDDAFGLQAPCNGECNCACGADTVSIGF